jgi:Rha family phage regulatory protein
MQDLVYYSPKGNAITDSVKIAEKFGKRHDHVLRDIDRLVSQLADNQDPKIGVVFYQVDDVVQLGSKTQNNRKFIMNRDGFSLLIMGFTGKKAFAFKLDFIAAFNEMEQKLKMLAAQQAVLSKHTARPVQIQNSKDVNAYQYTIGGTESVQEYNRENCKLVSGFTPSELRKQAKAAGIKSKFRTSGKEVLRNTKPELACILSLNDDLVKHGASLEQAVSITKPTAPLFSLMISLGMSPAELRA